jgi:hypothetical protein
VAAAVPVPSSQRPSRRRPGRGSRSAQPNLRAPSSKQASTLRLLNRSPDTGPVSGSLRTRSARARPLTHPPKTTDVSGGSYRSAS